MKTSYVVGFAFNTKKDHVLLIRKKRPEWQKGFYNGVGGMIIDGESPTDAMIREFAQEAGYATTRDQWRPLIKIICGRRVPGQAAEVYFFSSVLDIDTCRSQTDEQLMIFPVIMLDTLDTIDDLQWLVLMAVNEDLKETFTIQEAV